MNVVVTSPRFPERDQYRDLVEAVDGDLVYADCATEEDAVERCRDANVIVTGFVPVTERVMDAAPDLEFIMVHATGYDAVDVPAATARGIPVSNVPGYAPRDVASHAFTLLLSAAHDVVRADRDMRSGDGWTRRTREPLHGGTLGIVGLGEIGRKIVPFAEGFDMDVIAHDPYLADDVFDLLGVESVEFDDLLARSDAVTVHAPLTSITHHLFSDAEFERMKPSAVLVNTARGPIVDEAALVDAIEGGEIRAAGLDVFETEPPADSPVLDCDRIVCTPHVGGGTRQAADSVVAIARAELRRVLNGEAPRNVVNEEVFQYRGSQVTTPGDEVEYEE